MTLKDAALWLTQQLGGKARNIAQVLDEMSESEGSTPRVREMDLHERYYLGLQHDEKIADWDGRPYHDREHIQVYQKAALIEKPIYRKTSFRLRRPFVRKQLAPAIVDRFTGLLYGQGRLPTIRPLSGDGQEWIDALIKGSGWFKRWALARSYGGRMGSVAVGVGLRNDGTPFVDVVSAKWCKPLWVNDNPATETLRAIEIRYKRQVSKRVQVTDKYGASRSEIRMVDEWYLRIVDDQVDVVLTAPCDVREGGWEVRDHVTHGLGFCPWVWVKNTESLDDADGSPDFAGQLDNLDALDALRSGAFAGTAYNAEPTAVLKTQRAVGELETGNNTGIVLDPGDDAFFLEHSGQLGEAAEKRADSLEASILQDTRCVLDEGTATGGRSATELVKRTEAMHERADEFRAQYGQAMEWAFEMLLAICRLKNWKVNGITLPEDATPPSTNDVAVEWPPYVQMTPQEKLSEVQVYSTAALGKIISRRSAMEALATTLRIKDVDEEIRRLAAEASEDLSRYEGLLGNGAAPGTTTRSDDPGDNDDPPDGGDSTKPADGDET